MCMFGTAHERSLFDQNSVLNSSSGQDPGTLGFHGLCLVRPVWDAGQCLESLGDVFLGLKGRLLPNTVTRLKMSWRGCFWVSKTGFPEHAAPGHPHRRRIVARHPTGPASHTAGKRQFERTLTGVGSGDAALVQVCALDAAELGYCWHGLKMH